MHGGSSGRRRRTAPNAFTLSSVSGSSVSTFVSSPTVVTVAGLGQLDSVQAVVSGAASSLMRKNAGAWVSGPLSVVNGDTIEAGHTTGSTAGIVTSTTLTLGTASSTFTSTTVVTVPSPNGAPVITDGLDNPVTTPIVNQPLFFRDAVWLNGPITSRTKVLHYADNGAAVPDSRILGGDIFIPDDADLGRGLYLEEQASNASGPAAAPQTSTSTSGVVQINLSTETPVLTRTSASAASPFTATAQFSTKVFAGYQMHMQVATSATFSAASMLYDGIKVLSEGDLSAPFTPDWSGNTDPVPSVPYNNAAFSGQTVYMRVRAEAKSLGSGLVFTSNWSNVISNVGSGASVTVFWNGGSDTPASSTAYSLSISNTLASRTGLTGNQMVKGNTGQLSSVSNKNFNVTPNGIASISCRIGVVVAGTDPFTHLGAAANDVGYSKNGWVIKGGAIVLSSSTTYTSGDVITTIIKNSKVYFQKGGVDISGMNSTAETGGIPLAGATTYYPAASCDDVGPTYLIDGTLFS